MDGRQGPPQPARQPEQAGPGPSSVGAQPSPGTYVRAPNTQLDVLMTRLRALTNSIANKRTDNENIKKPKTLKTKPKPHQMEALKWMLAKENVQQEGMPCGGILADDMGLGKTASMVALILKSKEKQYERHSGPVAAAAADDGSDSSDEEASVNGEGRADKPKGGTLIICPASLMDHWESEIVQHVKNNSRLSVARHHGKERHSDPKKLARLSDVVITTYDLVRRDHNKGPLFHVSWDRVILDEAHEVRNPDSIGCMAVSSLDADHRWCVTGTPVHNSLLDLHAMFKFLNWAPYQDRETWEQVFGVTELHNERLWEELKRASILRRTKKQYADGSSIALPEKEEIYVLVEMDLNERETYNDVAQSSGSCLADFQAGQGNSQPSKKPMYHLLLLRQLCNHPSLLREPTINEDLDLGEPIECIDLTEDRENQNQQKRIQIQNEWDGTKRDLQKYLRNPFTDAFFDPGRPSTKMEKLLEILRSVTDKNDKAVVVSQWTKMLALISAFLYRNNISHKTISGEVPNSERPKIVKDFNDPSNALKVLLLSLKAGGVGLNLIGGNHLILYDPHWNPQLERQACDRVYRMGQPKPQVTIYKFIVRDTIEQVIMERQQEKLTLADTILDNPSQRNIRQLTSLGDSRAVISILDFEARRGSKRKAVEVAHSLARSAPNDFSLLKKK